jgi:hypothetical protein
LHLLRLFTVERPYWTAEEAALELLGQEADRRRGAALAGQAREFERAWGAEVFITPFLRWSSGDLVRIMPRGASDGMHLIYQALEKTVGKGRRSQPDCRRQGYRVGESPRARRNRSGDARHHQHGLHPEVEKVGDQSTVRGAIHTPSAT